MLGGSLKGEEFFIEYYLRIKLTSYTALYFSTQVSHGFIDINDNVATLLYFHDWSLPSSSPSSSLEDSFEEAERSMSRSSLQRFPVFRLWAAFRSFVFRFRAAGTVVRLDEASEYFCFLFVIFALLSFSIFFTCLSFFSTLSLFLVPEILLFSAFLFFGIFLVGFSSSDSSSSSDWSNFRFFASFVFDFSSFFDFDFDWDEVDVDDDFFVFPCEAALEDVPAIGDLKSISRTRSRSN